MEYHKHDPDELRRRYEAGASVRTLAPHYGVTEATIRRWLRRFNIAPRARGGPRTVGRYLTTLRTHCEEVKGMSAREIAERWNFDRHTLYRVLRRHHIEWRRSR